MAGNARELEEIASKQGVDWAERTFSRLLMWGRTIPARWPGTREYARALVLGFARHSPSSERERLVLILHRAAEANWREFTAQSSEHPEPSL